jgi:hypothetical protein
MQNKRCREKRLVELAQARMIVEMLDRFGEKKPNSAVKVPINCQDGPVSDPHERARARKKKELCEIDCRSTHEKVKKQLEQYDTNAAPLSKE